MIKETERSSERLVKRMTKKLIIDAAKGTVQAPDKSGNYHSFDYHDLVVAGCDVQSYNRWFLDRTLPEWEETGIADELRKFNDATYLEIGVNCGCSMVWAMNTFANQGWGIDAFENANPRKDRNWAGLRMARIFAEENLRAYEQTRYQGEPFDPGDDGRFVELLEMKSTRALSGWLASSIEIQPFDVVFVDGDHYAGQAIIDLSLSFQLLKPGGLIVADDMDKLFSAGRMLSRTAIMAFWQCFSNKLDPVYVGQRQACFRKTK